MSTDRLSDEVVRSYATEAYGPNHHPHLAMLAREVQERRAADAVAPAQVDDTPNPYRFTVDLSEAAFGKGWQVGLWLNGDDLWWSDVFVDHDDAREHAHLIARALREVTVDE